ncbi:MAG TPA: hypothetical protein VMN83_23140 [Albitalea sp.]|nr:hypothetical protein [Albitalea sp.]
MQAIDQAMLNFSPRIGLAVAVMGRLSGLCRGAGVAITSILWGVVHLTIGFAIAAMWMRMPSPARPI